MQTSFLDYEYTKNIFASGAPAKNPDRGTYCVRYPRPLARIEGAASRRWGRERRGKGIRESKEREMNENKKREKKYPLINSYLRPW